MFDCRRKRPGEKPDCQGALRRYFLSWTSGVDLCAKIRTGIQSGTTLSVLKEGEALIDPDTGMDLGSDTTKIADIKITEVQDKFSKAQIVGTPSKAIEKGDIVKE